MKHSIEINKYRIKDSSEKKEKRNKLLFLGNLVERKRVNFLIDWIKSSELEFLIDFAGKGILEDEIKELSFTDERVNYLGMIKKSQIYI